jgi:hypothetical protein
MEGAMTMFEVVTNSVFLIVLILGIAFNWIKELSVERDQLRRQIEGLQGELDEEREMRLQRLRHYVNGEKR